MKLDCVLPEDRDSEDIQDIKILEYDPFVLSDRSGVPFKIGSIKPDSVPVMLVLRKSYKYYPIKIWGFAILTDGEDFCRALVKDCSDEWVKLIGASAVGYSLDMWIPGRKQIRSFLDANSADV